MTDPAFSRPNVHIDYGQPATPYHQKIATIACRYASNTARILDVGCGVGHLLAAIQRDKPCLQLHAADIDDETLSITSGRVKLAGTIKISKVEDLFGGPAEWDIIIMSHVLEHTRCPLAVLEGIMPLLRPGGILIVAVPNPVRFPVIIGNVFKRHYVNRGHVYAWDRSHWINFLEIIARLDVIEYSEDFFPLPGGRTLGIIRKLEISLAKLFPWLAFSNIAVVAGKSSSPVLTPGA
jgi:2-polyprenyl-3-methyl-5-hydroxy-6-metoxy-1,4-benzoquinol methylase